MSLSCCIAGSLFAANSDEKMIQSIPYRQYLSKLQNDLGENIKNLIFVRSIINW